MVLTDAGNDFARTVRDILQAAGRRCCPARAVPETGRSHSLYHDGILRAASSFHAWQDSGRNFRMSICGWTPARGRSTSKPMRVDILITQAEGVAAHGTIDSHLIDDERVPLASPSLVSRLGNRHGRAALHGSALHGRALNGNTLRGRAGRCWHDESQVTWREWFAKVGLPAEDTISGSNFSDHALMVEAAAAGQGVALGSRILRRTVSAQRRARRPGRVLRFRRLPIVFTVICAVTTMIRCGESTDWFIPGNRCRSRALCRALTGITPGAD